MDGAYLTVPFPTCWCVGTLDPALQTSLERTYRSVLGEHLPAARDDAAYDAALLAVRAYWALRMLTWLLPKVVAEDRDWGRATVRQRVVLRAAGSWTGPVTRGVARDRGAVRVAAGEARGALGRRRTDGRLPRAGGTAYQCTPLSRRARNICSEVGASPASSPRAAAESGNTW